MRESADRWLAGEIAVALASALEGFTGERPAVEVRECPESPPPGGLRWRQTFSNLPGTVWIFWTDPDWMAAASALARALGSADDDPGTTKPELLEVIRQALSTVASALSSRIGREVVCSPGSQSDSMIAGQVWWTLDIKTDSWSATARAGIESSLSAALASGLAEIEPAAPKSKTYDLLLDVELPVSISFGRAQVPLKDVLKLTTGSVVDLNRDISDPVEIIVNNCVIARGEVVVIEGNFGVRIQQVISRRERLRTLA